MKSGVLRFQVELALAFLSLLVQPTRRVSVCTYYDLLPQSISYSVIGAPLTSAQELVYLTAPASYGQNDNSTQASIVPSQHSQTIWVLRGTTASTQTLVLGSYGERWATAVGSWLINSAEILPTPINYYQQYSQTLSYVASGSSLAPTLDYTFLGSNKTLALPSAGANFWADEGSSVSVSKQITGSGAQERWIATQTSWTISRPDSTPSSITYFHQYNVTLSFKELGGGSFEAPSLSYTSFGNRVNGTLETMAAAFWVDATTTYSVNSELQGSSSSSNSRFYSPTLIDKRNATGPNSSTLEYYHQYLVNISYSVIFGGDPANPSIVASVFGSSVQKQLDNQTNLQLWLDSGSSYTIQEFIHGSSQNERWITFFSNGTFGSPSTLDLAYYHQYYLNVSTSQPSGGSVSPQSGWYNATSSVAISATPNSGWQLASWSGLAPSGTSYSGNKSSVSITLNSPAQETATFYPGIDFDTTDGGSIAYNYGTHVGSVPPNSKTTIYIPPGTVISIAANPTFFVYKFAGWSGTSSQLPSTDIVASGPVTIKAQFAPDSTHLEAATAVVAGLGSFGLFFYWSGFNFVREDLVIYGGELWIVSSQHRKSGKKTYDLRRPFGTSSS